MIIKPWYQSKTMWANVVLFVIAVLGLLAAHPLFVEYASHLLLVSSIVNLVLRYFFTEHPLDFSTETTVEDVM
jgi:hypothetical protein